MTEICIQNERPLGAVVGVLSTFDQSIIDRSKMEEVKTYKQNLAIAFYDYKNIKSNITGCSEYTSELEYRGI